MYKLIGYKRACFPGETDEEDVVALFTTREKGNKYIKDSTLKSASKYGLGRPFEVFKVKSLLHSYSGAEIEECEEVPIDPSI